MARNDQVTRILKVIHYLEINPHGLALGELISKLKNDGFDVSERTTRRDLEAIQSVHFPLSKEGSGESVRWKIDSIATVNTKIQFSYQELLALFLARESLTTFRHTALFIPINNLFSHLEKILGNGAKIELENLKTYLEFKPTATWQSGVSQEVLNTIYDACAEGQVLNVTYRAKSGDHKDQVKSRRLGPEGLYFADSGVYLIAKDLDKGEHRSYAVARIVEAVLTTEAYESKDFSLKEFIKDSIGTFRSGEVQEVELQIQDPIATYVSERRWHETQQINRVESGIVLKMKVRVNDELARWVLSLGPSVTKVSPAPLQGLVLELAEAIVKNNKVKKAA